MNKKSFWKPRKVVGGLLGPLVLLAVFPAPANAYPRPGASERVSVASVGTEANEGLTSEPSTSADGLYVAFHSDATNLVPADINGARDIFVRDRETGATERVSVASDGTEGNGVSWKPSFSADGRYVAFQSQASNLVPGQTDRCFGPCWEVFVHDRETETTERVSVASDGTEGNSHSPGNPSISADGRYVGFNSSASNLVPGDANGVNDVFVHDRETGMTERVSVAGEGTEGNGHSFTPVVSHDARYVALHSLASNLVPGDTNGTRDVFVRDREAGTTERVSVASDGTEGNGLSESASISADGRHVAFYSSAPNLVPGDTNRADAFVHDRQTGTTERVSVAYDGAEANSTSSSPSLSADGRFVSFSSSASNLVPGDTNGTGDIFVHDRQTGTTERVSVGYDGAEANRASGTQAISADGRYVAFGSLASNLVPGDTNDTWDVFVRKRGRPVGVGALSAVAEGDRVSVSGWATFSGREVTSADDPDDDGGSIGSLRARDLGAELTGASLTHRPEDEDLLVSLRLASLPHVAVGRCVEFVVLRCEGASTGAGAPAILYGLEFDLEGTRYEIRALRTGATGIPPAAPYFALYRCDPDCTESARLSGGIGTTRTEVLVSAPLSVLGVSEGAMVREIRAYTATGEAAPGAQELLDEADLPDAIVPAMRVSLGIAPADTPASEVAYTATASPTAGKFSGTLGGPSFTEGAHRVWARACLGETCGARSVEVEP